MKKNSLALASTVAATVLMSAFSPSAFASSTVDRVQNLSQTEFNLLAQDFVSAVSYKAVAPGTPMGVTGFDVGAELSVTQLQNSGIWKKAGDDTSSLMIPKLHLHKGLPFNIDVGASLTAVPNSNIKIIGGEISYAILEGGIATPSLSIRAAGTRLTGVSQIDLDTKSLELTLSKGFVNLTPYVGVGRVWSEVTPNVAGLARTSPTANKVFAGLNANFGLVNVAGEVDRTGENQTVSVKVGFRF